MNPDLSSSLPITAVAEEVCDALLQGNVVLQAEPGAGKSTGLPLTLLNAGFEGKILLLEPRRLAAANVASRLASQLGEPVGKTVGLRMRGNTKVSADTRLEVVTEGVLTRILQNDPLLEGVAVVIFDEFHERSLHADLGLALCLDVQRNLRDDLRLLLMSATLDGEALCEHIDVESPIVCTVRQHPVEIVWCGESRDAIETSASRLTVQAMSEHDGDVLVFLPGVAEIEKTARLLEDRLPKGVTLHRLHGRASTREQRAATAAGGPPGGIARRVILNTSIAETSITIDGVRIVIDSGVERRARIDSASGAERLETVMASQASAKQRAGRAGRTQAGVCYRLWSKEGHSRRASRWQPELLRADLSPLLVELAQWGAVEVNQLPWIDAPPDGACLRAKQLLRQLGIWTPAGSSETQTEARELIESGNARQLDSGNGSSGYNEDGSTVAEKSDPQKNTKPGGPGQGLTEYGRAVAKLPLHPRLGHMLLWASQRNAATAASRLAVLLEERPPLRGADLSVLLRTSKDTARVEQLVKLLPAPKAVDSDVPPFAVLLAQAFPDRIAKRRGGIDARYQLSSGAGAVLHNEDSLAQAQWLVVAEMGGAGRELRIFSALAVEPEEISRWCANLVTRTEHVEWDDKVERVVAETRWSVGQTVIESKPVNKVDPTRRAEALLSAVQRRGLSCLSFTDDVREWQARVNRMRVLEGSDSAYPAVDDDTLLATLSDWLLPWLDNLGTLKSLQQMDLLPVLSSLLDYRQQQQLDEWLPVKYRVPSGSQHQLRYACDGNPVLAVKLQEMFGCRENPSVANGRVVLKIELLSPARRPVQITEDLANFWHNSYPAVKKDLSGRYPKHPWPDDPLNAEATARAKPRKQPRQKPR